MNYNRKSYGIVKAHAKGYDLAEAAAVGFIEFKDGSGDSPVLQSDDSIFYNKNRSDKESIQLSGCLPTILHIV